MGEPIDSIQKALNDLKIGKFVLIYDGNEREGEVDLVKASEFIKSDDIKILRKDGGGLIFLMTSKDIANKLKLPFLADMYKDIEDGYPVLKELVPNDIPYDSKSSFSLYINHRETFTGITDKDRSLTMKEFANLTKKIVNINSEDACKLFGKHFRSPGHVPICVSSKNLLQDRQGHTELVVSLLKLADITPVGSGCEMMGDDGNALSKKDAKSYAQKNDLVFLEGKEIIEACAKK